MPHLLPLLLLCLMCLPAAAEKDEGKVHLGITYATVDDIELKLDLHLPDEADGAPLIVWVHGGAWMMGSRSRCPLKYLTEEGFAVASISYRLSFQAVYPAQLHDCKAAVRFLRANAEKYGYDPERIAAAGASAGGHLVSLLGTTGNNPKTHGEVGEHDDVSCAVLAVYNMFGPIDLINMDNDEPSILPRPNPVARLLGADPDDEPELAKAADPTTYLDKDDPPMLIVHGTRDRLVPLSQSEYLAEKLEASGVDHQLVVIEGAGHGTRQFRTEERREALVAFFNKHLMTEP